jgi:hypothetical protein
MTLERLAEIEAEAESRQAHATASLEIEAIIELASEVRRLRNGVAAWLANVYSAGWGAKPGLILLLDELPAVIDPPPEDSPYVVFYRPMPE